MLNINILTGFVLFGSCLCCYGVKEEQAMDEIMIEEYPKYFSTKTWEAINRANDRHVDGSEKIIALVESSVEYVDGLEGRNNVDIQKNIDNILREHKRRKKYHGTAVASLIGSVPLKLPCYDRRDLGLTVSKPCDKNKMVISGITQHIKIVDIPEIDDELLKTLLDTPLTDEEKMQNRVHRNPPARIILNYSAGYDVDAYLPTIIQLIFQDYDIIKLMLEYHDNGKKWKKPHDKSEKDWINERVLRKLAKYSLEHFTSNSVKKLKEIDSHKGKKDYINLISTMMNHYVNNKRKWISRQDESLENLAEGFVEGFTKYLIEKSSKKNKKIIDIIESKKDSILLVAAAGNKKEKVSANNSISEIFKGRAMMEDDNIIGVAAGCGTNYDKVCSYSNYGNTAIDILSPGEHLPIMFVSDSYNSGAVYVNGTSFSTPLVTGVAALLAQCDPMASVKDIKNVVFKNAVRDFGLDGKIKDGKILDVKRAIDYMCDYKEVPIFEESEKIEPLCTNEDNKIDDEAL